MTILRRLGLSLAVLLFSFSIGLVAVFISLYFVIGTPQPLKQAINKSGIYDVPIGSALVQQEGAVTVPIADPALQQALNQAAPPAFLQSSSEQIIDGTYGWIQGKTPMPSFSIDLNPVKHKFADNIAAYVKQKFDTLPACDQIVTPPTSVDEVLAITCKPIGVSSDTLASTAREQIIAREPFLAGSSTIDANILKDAQGQPLIDTLAVVPTAYNYYLLSLYVLPLIIVLSALGIIYWSATKHAGLKRVAWLLISTGITGIIAATVGIWLLDTLFSAASTSDLASGALQEKVLIIVKTLAVELRTWWLGFGIGYLLAGIALLIVAANTKPKPSLPMGTEAAPQTPLQAPPQQEQPRLP